MNRADLYEQALKEIANTQSERDPRKVARIALSHSYSNYLSTPSSNVLCPENICGKKEKENLPA